MQQLQPLRRYLHVRIGHARDVAAGPIKAGDEAELDRDRRPVAKTIGMVVVAAFAASTAGVAGRGNHSHLTMNQISCHRRQPITSAIRPAIFDRDVTAIDVTGFAQPFEKG